MQGPGLSAGWAFYRTFPGGVKPGIYQVAGQRPALPRLRAAKPFRHAPHLTCDPAPERWMRLPLPLMLALLLRFDAAAASPAQVRTDDVGRFWATYDAVLAEPDAAQHAALALRHARFQALYRAVSPLF